MTQLPTAVALIVRAIESSRDQFMTQPIDEPERPALEMQITNYGTAILTDGDEWIESDCCLWVKDCQ